MAALSDEEEKVGTKDKKKKDVAPRLTRTRTQFNAQLAKDISSAKVLFNVIKDEANEAEEWILRFYEVRAMVPSFLVQNLLAVMTVELIRD